MLKKPKRTEDSNTSETAVFPVDGVKMESSECLASQSKLPQPSADSVADLEEKGKTPDSEKKLEQHKEEPTSSRACQISSQTSASCTFVPFSGGGQCLGGTGINSMSVPSSCFTVGPPEAKKPKSSHEVKVRCLK